jgi:translation initiation factor 1 (eIF-1/SUI1)
MKDKSKIELEQESEKVLYHLIYFREWIKNDDIWYIVKENTKKEQKEVTIFIIKNNEKKKLFIVVFFARETFDVFVIYKIVQKRCAGCDHH